MSKNYTCVSIYTSYQAAEQAIEKLYLITTDIKAVSIISKGHNNAEHLIGFYSTGEGARFHGEQAKFWNQQWQRLSGASFFWLPRYGPLAAAGPIVNLLVEGLRELDLSGGMNVLGVALFNAGIPRDSVKQYENAVKADMFLLIVHGEQSQVEKACEILHSAKQQVTVHIA